MRRLIRVASVLCAVLVVCVVFQSLTVRAVDPDSDGDGLTDLQETSTIYYQDVEPGTVPATIPDDDMNGSAFSASFASFEGVQPRLLANFTLDHGRIADLTGAVGYWNGSAWIDRYVWDPGGRFAGVAITSPDAVQTWQGVVPAAAAVGSPESTGKVEFRIDGQLEAIVTAPVGDEYRWDWDASTLGDRLSVLNATQYDGAAARAWSRLLAKTKPVELPGSGMAIVWGLASLGLIATKALINQMGLERAAHRMLSVAMDAIALMMSAFSVARAFQSQPVPIALGTVAKVLSIISMGSASASFISDVLAA